MNLVQQLFPIEPDNLVELTPTRGRQWLELWVRGICLQKKGLRIIADDIKNVSIRHVHQDNDELADLKKPPSRVWTCRGSKILWLFPRRILFTTSGGFTVFLLEPLIAICLR